MILIYISQTTEKTNDPEDVPFSASPLIITIRSVRFGQGDDVVQVQLLLENGEHQEQKSLILTVEQYCELHPSKGVISEEMYDQLESADEFCRALRAGESLLSYGSNSAQMLVRKLLQRGYSRDTAMRAADCLVQNGVIDEVRDMHREVEKCLRKLWGARRIRTQLWSRGFGKEALSELPMLLEEVDFVWNCTEWIRKHYGTLPSDADEQRRMMAALSRYGYSVHEIRAAIRSLQE